MVVLNNAGGGIFRSLPVIHTSFHSQDTALTVVVLNNGLTQIRSFTPPLLFTGRCADGSRAEQRRRVNPKEV